ncbi:hypothetical protein AGABI2DRAFT_143279 [Agaricus bisporus var. bisporus H97]|uniref:hypothetical protein n=1 Tax=Agaricus bisporus var. bisporus (strain H97 / ATCC MYA-4626 / FGSC 10389) TaxID=936046 RepID=UPI00029F638A|nr:hypothetical protein AGABI2DRAFT_143279 [Agaricus bisporus var. bisporus H97]EKV47710.1 hypothetical protein AGABI2DRAFT_143279 [Agaricus bisporus var. bisporus H97]
MSTCYKQRISTDFHQDLLELLAKCDVHLLPASGEVSYPDTLHMHVASKPVHGKSTGKRSFQMGQQVYYLESDGPNTPAPLTFFGEIGPAAVGTMTTAIGNFKPSHYNPHIRDNSTVKDVFALHAVSDSTPELADAFGSQVATISEIISTDATTPLEDFVSTETIEPLSAKMHGTALDVLRFTSGLKYSIPRVANTDQPAPKKVKLATMMKKEDATDSGQGSQDTLKDNDGMPNALSSQTTLITEPNAADNIVNTVKQVLPVGEHYHPSVLEDYAGDLFDLNLAQLVQQPYYDIRNNLIPPWQLKDKLRRGTVVVIDAFIYQLQIEKLKVVSPSDDQIEDPPPYYSAPIARDQPFSSQASSSRKRASDIFVGYSGDDKKMKVNKMHCSPVKNTASSSSPSTSTRQLRSKPDTMVVDD